MKTPKHVAIIMDGNGRWANQQGENRLHGHHQGVESVRNVVKTAADTDIEYLTIYAFSTENWNRPEEEVEGLMELLTITILGEVDELSGEGIRMKFIGDVSGLPAKLRESIHKAENTPLDNLKLTLVIALNYSARWEITEAVKQIAKKVQQGTLETKEITQDFIEKHLTTAGIPDPELLIRTSGEQRLSNFMLWQLSYTELYFTNTLWPEFGEKEFIEALEEYNRRERRFGKTSAQVKDAVQA